MCKQQADNSWRRLAGRITAGLLVIGACLHSGCSRRFYREQADSEVYGLIDQKANHPHWDLPDYTIEIDPRSRMFSPFTPDYQPMPTDDPTSHTYMHYVDRKRGYKHWHQDGDTPFVENPEWFGYLPVNEENVLELTSDESVRIGLLHSRNYQTEMETLYLSALDVSFERFRFDSQFFGGYEVDYTTLGEENPGAGGADRSNFRAATLPNNRNGIRSQKLLASGGSLVVGLANNLMWQFSGPDTHSAFTLLDFSLVQPLLRRGGRDVVMEQLTGSERGLLANVRDVERFRRGFYLSIVTGANPGPGANRRAGGAGGLVFAGGTGAGRAGGYLGLLQQQQVIRNQEGNVAALRNNLGQFEAFFDAGRITFIQVEQVRQSLLTEQSTLLSQKTAYQTSLDAFKITLGLPPQLETRIIDDLLDPFNLIDTAILPVQNDITAIQQDVGDVVVRIQQAIPRGPDAPALQWTEDLAHDLRQSQQYVRTLQEVHARVVETNMQRARDDIEKLEKVLPERLAFLDVLAGKLDQAFQPNDSDGGSTKRGSKGKSELKTAAEQLKKMPATLHTSLQMVGSQLDQFGEANAEIDQEITKLLEEGPNLLADQLKTRLLEHVVGRLPDHLIEITGDVLQLSLVQARARTESIQLADVQLDSRDAIEIAREHRRDWMNARASLVDVWRSVQVVTNDLESDLDFIFEGDISNTGDNPIRLQGSTGRLRVGLQFDAPLTRLVERNSYRETLIQYSQARRNYYAFEDAVAQTLRTTLRNIELNQLNFELGRASVQAAISQTDQAQLALQKPPQPGAGAQPLGATTGQDLVRALAALLRAQNNFVSIWVLFEVQRRGLDFDMGTMQLGPDGLWLDPGAITPENGFTVDGFSEHGLPGHGALNSPQGEEISPPEGVLEVHEQALEIDLPLGAAPGQNGEQLRRSQPVVLSAT